MTENWKQILDYPDYDVSDLGRVQSLKFGKTRILKPNDNGNGYLRVNLYANGKRKKRKVHRLVAEAFLGPRPEGHEVNHKDGIKSHNKATNLEWVTSAENQAHASSLGLKACGEQNGSSKLTTAQVIEMRRLHALGQTHRKLGNLFGLHHSTVGRIVRFERWRHVPQTGCSTQC